jgi:hypothetical protein
MRKQIMTHIAPFGNRFPLERAERHAWTAEDSHETAEFLLQCLGVVAAAILLYKVGPAVGLSLVAGSLAIGSYLRWRQSRKRALQGGANDGRANRGNAPLSGAV